MKSAFYNLSAISIDGQEIRMDTYKGKVVLIVNTASECGYTPQFEGLEKLYRKYKDKGLVVLGFPCNQFGEQEPGDEQSIANGCVMRFELTFPMFSKVDVKGHDAHPIFNYLNKAVWPLLGNKVKWNFTKFVVDKKGKPVNFFLPFTTPEKIEKYLIKILK